jgi:hypothetical protein
MVPSLTGTSEEALRRFGPAFPLDHDRKHIDGCTFGEAPQLCQLGAARNGENQTVADANRGTAMVPGVDQRGSRVPNSLDDIEGLYTTSTQQGGSITTPSQGVMNNGVE